MNENTIVEESEDLAAEETLEIRRLHETILVALDAAKAARDSAGRSAQGRHLAIIATEIEKLVALVEYYGYEELLKKAVGKLSD